MIRVNQELLTYVKENINLNTSIFTEQVYLKGVLITEQDKRASEIVIIQSGIAKCFKSDKNGKDFIQEFLGEGELIGELEIISQVSNVCSVSAITNIQAYKLSKKNFSELIILDKKFNQLIIRSLSSRLIYSANRTSFQQSNSIEKTVTKLIHLMSDVTEIISKQDIADYLGISVRSLNRTLNDLKEENIYNKRLRKK